MTDVGEPSRLVGKLYERHVSALQTFQQNVRSSCQNFDVEELNALTELRASLSVSRARADQVLRDEEIQLEHHRQFLAAEQAAFASRTPGDTTTLLQDRFHRDGVRSVATRDGYVLEERLRILKMYVGLREMHRARMLAIDDTNQILANIEAERRQRLRHLMESLMHELSIIAFMGVTESSVLVQRAVASINEQLVGNQRTCKSLISQLKQHELLKQRDYAETVQSLFRATLSVAQESCVLWTQQLLASNSFRFPQSRTAMLHRIQQALKKTKGEVAHALQGLNSVVETLQRTRSSQMLEICGGTEPNGWLRSFSDDVFKPVFSQSPAAVADEWRVFVDVILHNAQCSVVTLTEDTCTIEQQLISEMRRMCDCLLASLDTVYSPTEAEVALMREGSLDGEHLYPFHLCTARDDSAIESARQAASESFQSMCLEITEESAWFQRQISRYLVQQKSALDDVLMRAEGNVVKTFADATATLKSAAEKPLSHLRQFYVTQFENEKDYADQLSWLERDVASVTERLQHAGTLESAKQLCIKGMTLLEEIEKLHVRYHKQRTAPMASTTKATEQVADAEGKDMFHKLNVVPKPSDGTEPPAETVKPQKRNSKQSSSPLLVTSSTITLADGTQFYVQGSMRLGAVEPQMPAPQGDDALMQPPSPRDKGQDKKPPAKAQAAAAKAPTSKAEEPQGPAVTDIAPAVVVPVKVSKAFTEKLTPLLDEVFVHDCMIADGAVAHLKGNIRVGLLEWFVDMRQRALNSVKTYCEVTKKGLDKMINEVIRRHQRRAPTLQAQTYELRVRELHDGLVSRAKYFEWLTHRVEALQSSAEQHRLSSHKLFREDAAALQTLTGGITSVMSIAALESHTRLVNEKIKNIVARQSARQEEGHKQLCSAVQSILQECATYEADKLKSFDEGGAMSADEAAAAKETIRSTAKQAQEVQSASEKAQEELVAAQQAELESLRAAYLADKQKSHEELQFFNAMQEIFAQLKGKVSNQISVSAASQKSIETLLEQCAALLSPLSKADTEPLRSPFKTNYEASLSDVLEQRDSDRIEVPEDWSGSDEALSRKLIRTQLTAAAQLRQCVPAALLVCLEDLRRSVYLRGLFLGSLVYNVEFVPVPLDALLEPRRESISAGAAQPSAADSKKGAPKPKSSPAPPKSASPGPAQDASQSALKDGVIEKTPTLPKIVKAEVEAGRWSAACRDQAQQCIHSYFAKHPGVLARRGVLGAASEDVLETANQRVAEQDKKVAAHVAEATRVYREQVQRLFVMIHSVGGIVFNGLFNVSVSALRMRMEDVFSVFNGYYATMLAAKYKNSSLIKGSLALPGNRSQLDAIVATEKQRQQECAALLKRFRCICLREEQDEASRFTVRVCHVLTTMFRMARGIVSPDHVVPGEDIVAGEHKGLRRLLRQKMREDAAKELEGGATSANTAKDKKDAKKPEPKKVPEKPAAKPSKGGKGEAVVAVKDDDEAASLPLLEKQLHDYPGIVLSGVKVFTSYRNAHPDIMLPPNHYVQPSQWEAERQAALAEAAEALQLQQQADKKPNPKAPPKPSAKPAAVGAVAVAEVPEDMCPAVSGPRDRLHQQLVLQRSTIAEAFCSLGNQLGGQTTEFFDRLEALELDWVASWDNAIRSIRTETLKGR